MNLNERTNKGINKWYRNYVLKHRVIESPNPICVSTIFQQKAKVSPKYNFKYSQLFVSCGLASMPF